MNYLSLGLFCLWVLTEVLSAQTVVPPHGIMTETRVTETFAENLVQAEDMKGAFSSSPELGKLKRWQVLGHYRYHPTRA